VTNTVPVDLSDNATEYLKDWADAIGCDVSEVAGDVIDQYLEERGKI
jgi:hypothetical protein